LIVVEDGARVIDAIPGGDWDETVVIAEREPAEPVGFAEQVAARLGQLEREHKLLQTAELIVASRHDVATASSRRLVARALLSSLTAAGGGELIVVAEDADSQARDALLDLVSRLLSEIRSDAVTIRVQFRRETVAPPPKSGVRLGKPQAPDQRSDTLRGRSAFG
jgi:hypothetical protein